MLDPKKLRQSIDEIANNLARRGFKFDTKAYVNLNNDRNSKSFKIQGKMFKKNQDELRIFIKEILNLFKN